jgi:hypothetical protein
MTAPGGFPAAEFAEAWRQVVLWDEHTWGAADSVSDPDGENARSQWAYKKGFVDEADRRSRDLLAGAIRSRGASGTTPGGLDVLNTTGWERTEIVLVDGVSGAADDLVRDAGGMAVPSQRLKDGRLAFLARAIPAFGTRRFAVGPGKAEGPLPPGAVARASEQGLLENDRLKVVLDRKTGAVKSLTWKERGGIELVDPAGGWGLNEYLYIPGRDPKKAKGVEAVGISVGEPGPLVASLVVESGAPGARSLRRTLRLAAGSDRLEILDLIDKAKVREKEAVHIAFPFRVPDGEVRLDLGWGLVRPDADQIAGSCKDFFSVQSGADISNRDYGVTWTSVDAPLAEVGRMTDETSGAKGTREWRTEAGSSTTIFAYVMNNYWHTNYKADQEGPAVFRFVVRPHAGFAADEAPRAGIETARPLLALSSREDGAPAPGPYLAVSPRGVLISSLRPSEDGKAVLARLYNASGRPEEARLGGRALENGLIFRSSPFEERAEPVPAGTSLPLLPFEIITIRIEPRK